MFLSHIALCVCGECVYGNVFVCVSVLCECVYMRLRVCVVCVCVYGNVFVCVRVLCERVYVRMCVCGVCERVCVRE